MRLKLDENLGLRGKDIAAASGHDVQTVDDEGLCGSSDVILASHCCAEERCLVTLDMDFANPILYPPGSYGGIIVLRPRHPASTAELNHLLIKACEAMKRRNPIGKLWIVDSQHIREYQPEDTIP